MTGERWLLAGGVLSLLAAAAHLAVIAGGPDWYRFFGAGEPMARAAERGMIAPALITAGIAAVLGVWAAYAFSGARLLPRLPLLRVGLVAIGAVCLLRGAVLAPGLAALARGEARMGAYSTAFVVWSSAIVLALGAAYAIGTWKAWRALG